MTNHVRPAEAILAAPPPRTGTGKPKLLYIDCLRGYAILMVIATHVAYAFPELPYPVHRLTVFGWYGVQLFFLASCLTLMMSSAYERDVVGQMNVGNFFIRRFLRIAPMYYAAGIFYWFATSHGGANAPQALTAVSFLNSWSPATMPSDGGWQLVPGGWSIGVEFTFYLLFPAFFWFVTTWRRALAVFFCAVIIGAVVDSLVVATLISKYGFTPADNFLYFWFFNQASVFALGGVVFFAVQKIEREPHLTSLVRRHAFAVICACLVMLAILAFTSGHFSHSLMLRPAMPHFLPTVGVFSAAIIAFSQASRGVFVNRVVASMGKVSFSAYLLHFSVIELVLQKEPDLFHLKATGFAAIGAFGFGLLMVIGLTYMASLVTYRLVELPMMQMAKRLTRLHPRVARQIPSAIS